MIALVDCNNFYASCERVFSLAGNLFNDATCNLTDVLLEDRMWAKVNGTLEF